MSASGRPRPDLVGRRVGAVVVVVGVGVGHLPPCRCSPTHRIPLPRFAVLYEPPAWLHSALIVTSERGLMPSGRLTRRFHNRRSSAEDSSASVGLTKTQRLQGARMSTAERNVVSTADQDADRALKAKHRALWASGDYPGGRRGADPRIRGPNSFARAGSSPVTAYWMSLPVRATRPFRPRRRARSSPRATSRPSCSTSGGVSPQSVASSSSGSRPMRRRCRSRTTVSTW